MERIKLCIHNSKQPELLQYIQAKQIWKLAFWGFQYDWIFFQEKKKNTDRWIKYHSSNPTAWQGGNSERAEIFLYARRQKYRKGVASGTRLPLDWGERKINGGNCELSGDHHIFLITPVFPLSLEKKKILLTRKRTTVDFDPHTNSPRMFAIRYKPHFARNERQIQHLELSNIGIHIPPKELEKNILV